MAQTQRPSEISFGAWFYNSNYYAKNNSPSMEEKTQQIEKAIQNDILDISKKHSIPINQAAIYYNMLLDNLSIDLTTNGREEGLNKVTGYPLEKYQVTKDLLLPLKAENANLQEDYPVPDGMLFCGITGTGKTHFARALGEHIEKLNLGEFKEFYPNSSTMGKDNPAQIIEFFEEAEEKYQQTGKRQILFFDNFDFLLDYDELPNVYMIMLSKLIHCSENGITWLATSTYSEELPDELQECSLSKIELTNATPDEKSAAMGYYWKQKNREDRVDHAEILENNTYAAYLLGHLKTQEKRAISQNSAQGIKIPKETDTIIQNAITLCDTKSDIYDTTFSLDDLENENLSSMEAISNSMDYPSLDNLQTIRIGDDSLIDFWFKLDKKDEGIKYTPRLKQMWLKNTLNNKDKLNELIALTFDYLQENNSLIQTAKSSYSDILENETELDDEQQKFLIQQQENALFFKAVSNNLKSSDVLEIESSIIQTIKQLTGERNNIKNNADENIFSKAKNIFALLSENGSDKERVDFVLSMISQLAAKGNGEDKKQLKELLEKFKTAKASNNVDGMQKMWSKIVDIAQNYFETDVLDEITAKNITLLNSINEKRKDIEDKAILKIIDNPLLTIEQKEFAARYANNKNFRLMIKNPNVDKSSVLEDLVLYETQNRNIIAGANLDISDDEFNKMMSDKFHQINSENKDINIQGDKIVSKLNEINSSINSQSDLINQFADKFSNYALSSLTLQNAQLNELIEISNNTQEIKQYTQALTRAKLVELEKDKNYKDIVPEITKLLPDNEQIDIQDFLLKIDELAENEKNAARKKKILKIGSLIAGGAAAGGALYYFGPQIVAHLLSNSTANLSGVITKAIMDSNTARMLGNGSLISKFPFKGVYEDTARQIRNIEYEIEQAKKHLKLHPDDKLTAEKLDNLIKKLGNSKDKLKKLTS